MIITVTPNAAVDRVAIVKRLAFDQVVRPEQLTVLPGGKGVNVARAAHLLGAEVATTGFIGGEAGQWIRKALAEEELKPRFVECTGQSRTTYTVAQAGGRTLLIYEEGPKIGLADLKLLTSLLAEELIPAADQVVLAGSFPPGVPAGFAAEVVDMCRNSGRPVLIDVSGPPLLAALSARPRVVKIDLQEATDAGLATPGPRAAVKATEAIADRGVELCIVTDGARGAVARQGNRVFMVHPAPVDPLVAVGSGDSFAAGLLVALEEGRDLPEALALGAAAGAANTLELGAGRLDPALCRAMAAEVVVRDAADVRAQEDGRD